MNTTTALRLPAPAKLNLTLRVVGRREDGYHLLQTVFQFIDHCDWITFHPRDDGQIRLMNPLKGVPEAVDLTIRAAVALREYAGVSRGVTLEVEKNLPMGGGLGGGSSDAATTLLGLNQLWGLGYSSRELKALGLKLGADVPVFIEGHAAWAEGIGERLTPLSLPEPWFVVIVPKCHVATGDIFSADNLTRNSPAITIADFMAGRQENHCLPVVVGRYPEVAKALEDLSLYGDARLTGTGACVFAAFEVEQRAHEVVRALGSKWNVFVAKGLNQSPVHKLLT